MVHQKGLFDEIKENPNFPSCRGILDIYRQWLLRWQSNERVSCKFYFWNVEKDNIDKHISACRSECLFLIHHLWSLQFFFFFFYYSGIYEPSFFKNA